MHFLGLIMGRIRTKQIKRLGHKFIELYKDNLHKEFQGNKQKVQALSDVRSKKLRNKIAGYITKKMKTAED
jgi:small subunit ribosomal protein S17e